MLVLCVLVLVALGVDTLVDLSPHTRIILLYADTAVCGIFFLDFLWSLKTAEHRGRYLITWGWIDFISSIPAVGVLRIGRAARLARILKVLRGLRSARVLVDYILARRAQSAMLAAILTTILVVVFSSIAIIGFETAAGGNLTTAQDALWWSMVTVSTAGFGDFYPISPEGRIIAVALMITGIGLFGTFTAFVASWFLQPSEEDQDRELEEIKAEIKGLRTLIERRQVKD